MKKILTNIIVYLAVLVALPLRAQVIEEWVARYNGPGNSFDQAIVIDGANSVYVAGYSDGSGINADYATVKYSQIVADFRASTACLGSAT